MKLTAHCYAVLGLACEPPWTLNTGFIAGAARTLVVDTGMNLAAAATIHGYATAVSPANRLVVVNTEPHWDHLGGNLFFRNLGIDVYGHPAVARDANSLAATIGGYNACGSNPVRRQRQEGAYAFAGVSVANPNKHIGTGTQWDLGGTTIRILLTPGHTPANLSILVPQERVLYCGDCLAIDYLPNLEEGSTADWQTWLQSLDRIASLDPAIVVPGHGRVLRDYEISREIERTRDILEEAIARGKAPTHAP